MAPAMATSRLRKELTNLHKDPPPGVIAEPLEKDILVWYYAVRGPVDTPYEGGIYIGKLKFPTSYPMNAPSIYMLTPSGRFQINTKICMSMSDFHPESWNPMWSVATIIQGIQSFMASDELTTGGLKAPQYERKRLATSSMIYNKKTFTTLFDGDIEGAFERAEEARTVAEKMKVVSSSTTTATVCSTSSSNNNNNNASENTATGSNQTTTKTVRGGRRRRAAAAKAERDNTTEDDENEEEETTPSPKEEVVELTPEEMEKRRKRNAKKRAKQKAKKAAAKKEGGAVEVSPTETN